jgi:hypothetical protein
MECALYIYQKGFKKKIGVRDIHRCALSTGKYGNINCIFNIVVFDWYYSSHLVHKQRGWLHLSCQQFKIFLLSSETLNLSPPKPPCHIRGDELDIHLFLTSVRDGGGGEANLTLWPLYPRQKCKPIFSWFIPLCVFDTTRFITYSVHTQLLFIRYIEGRL